MLRLCHTMPLCQCFDDSQPEQSLKTIMSESSEDMMSFLPVKKIDSIPTSAFSSFCGSEKLTDVPQKLVSTGCILLLLLYSKSCVRVIAFRLCCREKYLWTSVRILALSQTPQSCPTYSLLLDPLPRKCLILSTQIMVIVPTFSL